MISPADLLAVMPRADPLWAAALNSAMAELSIDANIQRESMFLGQIAEESCGLTQLVENLNYSASGLESTWPSHFDDEKAFLYAHQPERIANYVYAGRNGNGDEASGDGWRYRGRGPSMLSEVNNYRAAGTFLVLDLIDTPDLVATDNLVGARCAAWVWFTTGCNALADAGDFKSVTRHINGGLLGFDARQAYYLKFLAQLNRPGVSA